MPHHSSSTIALSFAMLLASVSPVAGAARLSLAEPRELSSLAGAAKRAAISRSLAAGDFDGDHRDDLVAASRGGGC